VSTIDATSGLLTSTATGSTSSFSNLSGDDFLKLLLTQIANQDPLEPMGNQELMEQISSIRNLEMTTTLTNSLKTLTGQQRFTSAAALIGQYVAGTSSTDGTLVQGVVTAVRFDASGAAVLQLSSGTELPLEQVQTVAAPQQAAAGLVGLTVAGVDRRATTPEVREGVVTASRVADDGQVVLELDTGNDLRLIDVVTVRETA